MGLGTTLMHQLIDYARADGIAVLEGSILRENVAMLKLAEELGFKRLRDADLSEVVTVALDLRPVAAHA
jgi:acetyltransferase